MTDKPALKPSSEPRAFEHDPDVSRFKRIALIGFIILLVGIFVVVVMLPAQLAKKKDPTPVPPEIGSVEPETVIDSAKAKEAKDFQDKVLELQARLENDSVNVWGAEKLVTSYDEVRILLEKANMDYDGLRYDQALAGYRQTIEKLEQLEAGRPQRAVRALQMGDEALARLESQSAIQHYKIAFAADPSQSRAQTGLQRAENLPQVLNSITEGERHENDGRLDLARQRYNDAVLLDKEFQPARDHLDRIDAVISSRDFLQSMSDAASAMDREDIQQAKTALAISKNLQPDSPGVLDLARQLKKVELRVEFQQLGQQALKYEMAEEWEKAVEVYTGILKTDANAGFALEGKKRAQDLLDLSRRVQSYLTKPEDLKEPEHLSHARQVYALAVSKSDAGPKFRGQTERLNSFIAQYSRPISVLVQSDNMTDVRIYRVGRLGQFFEHDLELLPGSYTAVGMRSGYRDVSVPFTVPVTGEQIILKVNCEEKI